MMHAWWLFENKGNGTMVQLRAVGEVGLVHFFSAI